jgi:hypothetical protein
VVIESTRNPSRKRVADSRCDVFGATHDGGADSYKPDRGRRCRGWIQLWLRKETSMVRANIA